MVEWFCNRCLINFDEGTAFCPKCHNISSTAKINSKDYSLFRIGNGRASNVRIGSEDPLVLELSFTNNNAVGNKKMCQISLKINNEFENDLMNCFQHSRDTVRSSAKFRFVTQESTDDGYLNLILYIEGKGFDGRCARCHFLMKRLIEKGNENSKRIIFNNSCQRFDWYNTT
jgi:hypothetical protein